jgi:hypothetical protein
MLACLVNRCSSEGSLARLHSGEFIDAVSRPRLLGQGFLALDFIAWFRTRPQQHSSTPVSRASVLVVGSLGLAR